MKHIWISMGLVGCIAPSIQIEAQDSATPLIDTGEVTDTDDPIDTDETDTEETDTEETDTEDTDTDTEDTQSDTLDPDYGTAFMRDQYLRINGDMVAGTSLLMTAGVIDESQSLYGFLKAQNDWGFAVSLGAYDSDSHARMMDQPISLFRANGTIVTLSWVPKDAEFRPLIMVNRFMESGGEPSLCEQTVFGSSNGDTLPESVLKEGYRVYVFNQDISPSSAVQMYVQYSSMGNIVIQKMFGSMTIPTGQCAGYLTDDFILFGKGGEASSILPGGSNTFDVPDIDARVDDIVLFNDVGVQTFLARDLAGREELLNELYADTAGATFMNDSRILDGEDGWHWYPIDPNPTLRQQNKYNELWDETQHHVDVYMFSLLYTQDGVEELTPESALEYYYTANERWFPN